MAEEVEGLLGTYVIDEAMHGRVHALSPEDVERLHGREIAIEATWLKTPWLTCGQARWQHDDVDASSLPAMFALSAEDEQR